MSTSLRPACLVKDARSVLLYPYNQSHILQYFKYTNKINIAKKMCKILLQIMCFRTKK